MFPSRLTTRAERCVGRSRCYLPAEKAALRCLRATGFIFHEVTQTMPSPYTMTCFTTPNVSCQEQLNVDNQRHPRMATLTKIEALRDFLERKTLAAGRAEKEAQHSSRSGWASSLCTDTLLGKLGRWACVGAQWRGPHIVASLMAARTAASEHPTRTDSGADIAATVPRACRADQGARLGLSPVSPRRRCFRCIEDEESALTTDKKQSHDYMKRDIAGGLHVSAESLRYQLVLHAVSHSKIREKIWITRARSSSDTC